MDWSIVPYVGVGEIQFGMDPREVEVLLGQPRKSSSRGKWTRFEFRDLQAPSIAYDDRGLGEINFDRHFGQGLFFKGHDVFAGDPEKFLKLVSSADDSLIELRGTIVSRELGFSLGGFRADEDPNERALSVFRRGLWADERLAKGEPVRFP